MDGFLEDQLADTKEAFKNAHEAGNKEAAQALAQRIFELETKVGELKKAEQESTTTQTGWKSPAAAAGVGATVGAVANPLRGAVHDIVTPTAPKAAPVSTGPAPGTFGGEDWTKSLTGVDVPGAQMNKGSLQTGQRMAETVGRNGPLAGGSISPGGILLGPEIGAKPPVVAPVSPLQRTADTSKSLLKDFVADHQPTRPMDIVKGGSRGALTGATLADMPQQLTQGNYGTAASDFGVAAGNILHGLSRTPKGKALGALLGLGSGVTRAYQGMNELMPPEQKAQGGLVGLATGGQPEFGEARAYEPSYSEKIRDYAAKFMSPEQADVLFGGPRANVLDEFNPIGMTLRTPGVIADAAKGFYDAAKEGEYLKGMGNYLTGAINVAPMIKPGAQVTKTAIRELGPKAADLAENYLAKIGGIQYAVPPGVKKKFSEAIEPYIGTHSFHPTIVDKTKLDLNADRMAGPEAAYLQEISQPHKDSGWIFANDSLGAANKLYNIGKDGNTLITGLLGSPTQLKTNRSVFGEIADEYFKAIKEGKMSPELQAKIEARLPTLTHGADKIQTFPDKFDIRDRDAFNEMAKGFHQRGHLADIMGGKGVSQGLPRGAGKIIPYDDILMRNTEQSLLEAPTHSVGSRFFTVGDKPPEYRPDLHNAFDYANFGKIMSDSFGYAPKEFAYPDEIARIKASLAARGMGREVTAMDLMRNTIKQPITEKLWRNAQDAGF